MGQKCCFGRLFVIPQDHPEMSVSNTHEVKARVRRC